MALNPWQQAISDLARSMGLRGQAEQQVYQSPQYQNLITQFFGAIPLPAGVNESMVRSRSGANLTYLDPEGYEHILQRDLSGISPRLGQVSEASTNRPAVLPLSKTNPQAASNQQTLEQQLMQVFQNPVQFSTLDTRTTELLAMMKAAEDQQLQQQFDQQTGNAVAQLVGRGVGSSSIAGQIMSQLNQSQGLVRNQAQGQQAERELGLIQGLTQLQQGQNQNLQQFVTELFNQGLSRDISGAQIGVQQQQVNNQNDQFYANLQQQILQFQEQMRQMERQAMWNNIFKGVAAATGVASGVASGGFGSLFGGGAPTGAIKNPGNIWPQN